ncbi:MAG TPA: S9 family peptidase [Holophagaceae bacterium]|nr:S9 family peptidase [Holophagaceae bacterium]
MRRFPILLALVAAMMPLMSQSTPPLASPLAPKRPHEEKRHGEAVADDYFWLREKQNPEVVKYLEAENAYTAQQTGAIQPFADALYIEMLGRIKQTDLSVPQRRGAWWYYSRTVEGQQYPIQCRKPGGADAMDPGAAEQVILDQNELAKGKKFLGLGGFRVSDDGARMLYSTDETGFRQFTLFEKDLGTGQVRGPLAERVTSFAWTTDGHTVFYTTEDAVTKRSDMLWRLDLASGAPEKLYEEKDQLYRLYLSRSKDKRFLFLGIGATDSTEVRFLDAAKPSGAFQVFLPRKKDHKYELDHREGLFYIRTNMGAKNYKLMTAPDGDLAPERWKAFIAHDPHVLLEGVELFKDYAVAIEKKEGLARFRAFDFRKGSWRELAFPEEIYAAYNGGNPEYDQARFRFSYQSPVTPDSVFDCDLATGERKLLKQQEVLGGFDPSRYECHRLWAKARDGVKVPLSVVYRKGTKPDGKNPLWLYGYGSYGYGMSAGFSHNNISLLDRGVVYAIAHIRGGDEMGEAWHDDGMLMKKKNTFHDFIDCAEWLVSKHWTSKDRLVIEGGSAGGLLMGAVTNLRPDLFKAVHAAVPFVDVMNTMMDATLPLTVGEYLEWGDPNQKPAYDYMRSYSPYDNLARKAYPAMLVTTSFNDSQVMYWEPAKYVARLRTLKTDTNPLLLKCKMDPAGHGGASGRYDALKDRAWELAWMLGQVGISK